MTDISEEVKIIICSQKAATATVSAAAAARRMSDGDREHLVRVLEEFTRDVESLVSEA